MANVLGELFGDIATAIRSKTGEEGTMKPAEFPEKIKTIGLTTVYKLQNVTGFQFDSTFGAFSPGFVSPSEFVLKPKKSYIVCWDDVDYTCEAFSFALSGMTIVAIGNASSLGMSGNDEPFLITYNVTANNTQFHSTEQKAEHTIGIYTPTESQSGGSSDDLRYVTFMSYDGSVEYGKKAVATGDDCADPIARGVFDTPTRESTVQYNYTFAGWATVPNGGKDANALKAVNEDRTVYANYVSAVRYYTITFYDSDGSTVLATKSVAYGSVPSYTPTKEGYLFANWVPDLVAVTGQTSYKAAWSAKPAFETSTWEEIAEVCAAGMAASTFSVGDRKPVTLNYDNGTSETIYFRIVDMGVDGVKGGGKASLTIMADNIVAISPVAIQHNAYGKAHVYEYDNIGNFLSRVHSALPAELRAVIKPYVYNNLFVEKTTNLFIPHSLCLGVSNDYGQDMTYIALSGYTQEYKYFANGGSIKRTKVAGSTVDDYWTATICRYNANDSYGVRNFVLIDGTARTTSIVQATEQHGIVPCFCI